MIVGYLSDISFFDKLKLLSDLLFKPSRNSTFLTGEERSLFILNKFFSYGSKRLTKMFGPYLKGPKLDI